MSTKRPMVVIKQMSVSAHFRLLYKNKNKINYTFFVLKTKAFYNSEYGHRGGSDCFYFLMTAYLLLFNYIF